MDTRSKIVTAAPAGRTIVVIGYFDPLVAAHALRLNELRRKYGKVIVVLDTPPEPLLDLRARAELLAALDAVDAVIVGANVNEVLDSLATARVIDEREADLEIRAAMIERVRQRQSAPAGVG